MTIKRAASAVKCLLAATICGGGEVYARGEERAAAVEVRCATPPNVVVHTARRKDALMACHGARDATEFLASQGLEVRRPVTIDVVPKLPTGASDSAAGCYLENRAVVLTYSEFSKQGTWFEIEVDRALYRSLVAHEVAHSIAAANFSMPSPTIQAHEYIAYVTMFATMARAQRERVLSKYPGKGFDDDLQMSATIYLFDPMRFGVQSYRHYLKQTRGRAYLHALLSGDALAE